MNKKILVLLPFAFYRSSGSSLSSYYRIRALLELGHKVDIITYPHGEELDIKNLKIFRFPKQKIFKTLQPGEYKKKIVYDLFLFLKFIKLTFRNNYDVIIAHSSMIYWTILLKPFLKSIFVANAHGNLEVELHKWNISKNKKVGEIASKIDSFFIKYYAKTICEHNSVKERLIAKGIKSDKLLLIGIAVFNKNLAVQSLKKKNKKFFIIYTGTFVKVQNLELIYKVAKLLKKADVEFWLFGGIDKEVKYETKLIVKYGVENTVKIFPRKPQPELAKYYEKADIVISPRVIGYDTPMKIFDYMNYGKCILATNKPIHTEILTNKNSYLTKDTPEAFAKAILFLKDNLSIVEKLGISAKNDFEDKYSFDIMKEKYSYLINSF